MCHGIRLFSIDRIEEGIAVCISDDDQRLELQINELYVGAKEGDCIAFSEGGAVHFDEAETARRKKRNISLQNSLFE